METHLHQIEKPHPLAFNSSYHEMAYGVDWGRLNMCYFSGNKSIEIEINVTMSS